MHDGLLMDMQEEEMPKEHQETGSGTESRIASDFPSKPEDPTHKDKSKKSEWVCIMKNLTHPQ